MMTFTIHEELEENEFSVYQRSFASLEELMKAIDHEWSWAKVEISTTFGKEIILTIDNSEWSEN